MKNLSSKKVLYVYSGKLKKNSIGIDLVVKKQIEALIKAGCKILLISRGYYRHNSVFNLSIPLTPAFLISFFPARYYYNAQYRFFSLLGSYFLKLLKFDFIITWSGQAYSLLSTAKKKKVKSFLNCRSSFKESREKNNYLWPYINTEQIQSEYSLADFLLLPSDFSINTFLSKGFSKKSLINIKRGVDLNRFYPKRKNYKLIRVVFFGSVSERKGIYVALEAWRLANLKDAELLVIGNVPKEVLEKIKSFTLKNVKFLGHQIRPEKYLRECHIQILPTSFEGMPKSLIEGAACGLVTLTTKESGFPILEKKNGFYIEKNNSAEYAKKLILLTSDFKLLKLMSKNSEIYAKKFLTWDKFKSRFILAICSSL